MDEGGDGCGVGDEGEGFGGGAADDGVAVVLEGLDEVGGGGGADRAYCFCEVEAGDAAFVAEAFDHLLECCGVGFGVEGFVYYLVADCFVQGVGFFGV